MRVEVLARMATGAIVMPHLADCAIAWVPFWHFTRTIPTSRRRVPASWPWDVSEKDCGDSETHITCLVAEQLKRDLGLSVLTKSEQESTTIELWVLNLETCHCNGCGNIALSYHVGDVCLHVFVWFACFCLKKFVFNFVCLISSLAKPLALHMYFSLRLTFAPRTCAMRLTMRLKNPNVCLSLTIIVIFHWFVCFFVCTLFLFHRAHWNTIFTPSTKLSSYIYISTRPCPQVYP